jgi:hypothetical protein
LQRFKSISHVMSIISSLLIAIDYTYTHTLIIPFTFSKSGWSVVRSVSLAKGGISKKRPSPHLHKVLTRSNKVSPPTFQTDLVVAQPS